MSIITRSAPTMFVQALLVAGIVACSLFIQVARTQADDEVPAPETEVVSETIIDESNSEGTVTGAVVVSGGDDVPPPVEPEPVASDGGAVEVPIVEEQPIVQVESEVPAIDTVVETTTEAAIVVPQTDDVTETVSSEEPTLTTDKGDYHPGETATIFGRFFTPVKDFVLKIFGSDENDQNYTETNETVTTDDAGSFSFNYVLDAIYRPFYRVAVSTPEGAVVAETYFRDSSLGTYDQCSNDLGDGYVSGDTGCRWTNGNIQANNSVYHEGDSTVQRLSMDGYAPGSSHTVTFKYGTTKGGSHAYDYLTTWDASENWVTVADRCQDISGCTTAAETQLAMQNDPNVTDTIEPAAAGRSFTMRGGSITAVSVPAIVSGTYAGDSETAVTVTFTVANSGSMCSVKQGITSCSIALWFGAHVARGEEWTLFNGTSGAGSIPGSPYHVALDKEDGTSIGQRDNQMQSAAIVEVPLEGSITIVKQVVGADGQFDFSGDITATLSNGQSQTTVVPAGTYTVTEAANAAYALTGLTCSDGDSSGNTGTRAATFVVAEGEQVTCTFTNSELPTLTLTKTVINDNGGTKVANDFQGKIDTINQAWSTPKTLTPGAHTASETTLTGYAASAWGTDCAANGSVTLAYGDHKTCSITNDDQPGTLIVHKVTDPSSDTTTQFSMTAAADGSGAVIGSTTKAIVGGGTASFSVNAGTYDVTETVPAGWSKTGDTCQNVVVANGETKECTITNIQLGSITIVKDAINNAAQDFTFHDDFGGAHPATFLLDDDANGALPNTRTFDVVPGTYAISEDAVTGWQQESATCTDGSPVSAIALGAGESVTCTFVNEELATIVLVKHAQGNDSAFDFTMTGSGLPAGTTLTTQSGWATETFSGLDQDNTYSVAETVPAGWDLASATCTGTNVPASITPNPGETVTCTFTNVERGHLIVEKTTDPADDPTVFTIHAAGTGSITGSGTSTVTDATDANYEVTPGTYSVTETVPAGWDKTGDTCQNVTVAAGETKTCLLTNVARGHIIVDKVTEPSGDTQSFDFTTNAGSNFSLTDAAAPHNSGAIVPGTYSVSETVPTGWDQVSATCSDGSDPSSIALAAGETVTCTFTNGKRPTLTLAKTVVNDNGGTAVATDFTPSIDTDVVTWSSTATLAIGAHTASETNLSGYDASDWGGDCAADGTITLAYGDHKTCTITNDDQTPILHLRKVVVNDNGGTAVASDWTLTANGSSTNDLSGVTPVDSGAGLKADTFALSESGPDDYSASAWVCVGGSQNGANITLGLGEEATCTITNDDIAPQLTLNKVLVNDNGGTAEESDWTLTANGGGAGTLSGAGASGDTDVVSGNDFASGTYALSESTGPSGYASSSWSCVKNEGSAVLGASITLGIGDSAVCTITNDDIQPTLTLVKTVVNNNGGTKQISDFPLFVDQTSAVSGVAQGFDAGSYTASETPSTDYAAGDWGGDCAANGTVTLAVGDHKTCTITNDDKPATLTIVKDAQPNDAQDFEFTGTLGAFTLDDDAGVQDAPLPDAHSNSQQFSDLNAGSTTVTETAYQYWTLKNVICVITGTETPVLATTSGMTLTVNLSLGSDVTCTFVNEKLSPTRTQGFWQTHTTFTNSAFAANFAGGMLIGSTTNGHKGLITNLTTSGASQLYGALYSSIPKKTDNKQRTPLDKARMQLLQQLVTAKLNCAAFGCATSVQTIISQADAAYAGSSAAAILASASLLDAYNNSGDTIIVGSTGKATPKTSQDLANKVFWNAP